MYAVYHAKGNPEVVQLLIDNGADVNMGNNRGETALDGVFNRVYMSDISRDVHVEDYLPIAKCLLQNGAKINKGSAETLAIAAERDDIELVQLLLNAGANPNEKARWHSLPIFLADSPEVIKALLGAGVDPCNVGRVLLRAARYGQDELVKFLLDIGVDVNIAGNKGDTPLILAIQFEQTPTALLLIDAGADVNSVGERATPLIEAGITGLLEVTKALIAHGAYKGLEEALKLAEERGHTKVASYLRQVIAEQGTRGSRRPRRRR